MKSVQYGSRGSVGPHGRAGCVVGLEVISMQNILQLWVRLCMLTAASGLEGQPFVAGGLRHQSRLQRSNVTFYLLF